MNDYYCIRVFNVTEPDIEDGSLCFDGYDSVYLTTDRAAAEAYLLQLSELHPHCTYKLCQIVDVP